MIPWQPFRPRAFAHRASSFIRCLGRWDSLQGNSLPTQSQCGGQLKPTENRLPAPAALQPQTPQTSASAPSRFEVAGPTLASRSLSLSLCLSLSLLVSLCLSLSLSVSLYWAWGRWQRPGHLPRAHTHTRGPWRDFPPPLGDFHRTAQLFRGFPSRAVCLPHQADTNIRIIKRFQSQYALSFSLYPQPQNPLVTPPQILQTRLGSGASQVERGILAFLVSKTVLTVASGDSVGSGSPFLKGPIPSPLVDEFCADVSCLKLQPG